MSRYDYVKPKILECLHYSQSMNKTATPVGRIVKDYEIDFNLTGERTMWVDGRKYEITPGCVVCRTPGQLVKSIGNYNMYTLTLDFSSEGEERKSYRPERNTPSELQKPFDSYYWEIIPTCFSPLHSAEILTMYQKLNRIFRAPNRNEEADALLAALLHLLLSDAFLARMNEKETTTAVNTVIAYISEHYAEKINLDLLATVAVLNKSYLVRLFRKETGVTPIEYLNHIRLSASKKLLVSSSAPLKEIAYHCGFESPGYFISRFQKAFGMTPGAYRSKNRE